MELEHVPNSLSLFLLYSDCSLAYYLGEWDQGIYTEKILVLFK